MKRIYFKVNEDDCLTPCEIHPQGIAIGSVVCQKCEHNTGIDFTELWVDCAGVHEKDITVGYSKIESDLKSMITQLDSVL
ncbi:hypothetical protein KAR91_45755 [Candidatus Pacearchaeota archaeon]|nr:hypothetical protein [Candidatus Pacearchaeota archaeon]